MGSRINGWGGGVGGGSSIASSAGGIGTGSGIQSKKLTTLDISQRLVPQKDLQFWMMASNGTRAPVAKFVGDQATQIRDFSGNNNNLRQTSISRMPSKSRQNGVQALYFDESDVTSGIDDSNFDFGTNDFTFVIAAYASSQTGNKVVLSNASSFGASSGFVIGRNSNRWLFAALGGSPAIIQTTSTYVDQWNVVFARRTGTTLQFQVYRGRELLESKAGNASKNVDGGVLSLGAFTNRSDPFKGGVAEVAIYGRAINAGERTRILRYLNAKYSA